MNPMGLGELRLLGGGSLPLGFVLVGSCVLSLHIAVINRESVEGLVVAVPLVGFNDGVWSHLPEVDVPPRTP